MKTFHKLLEDIANTTAAIAGMGSAPGDDIYSMHAEPGVTFSDTDGDTKTEKFMQNANNRLTGTPTFEIPHAVIEKCKSSDKMPFDQWLHHLGFDQSAQHVREYALVFWPSDKPVKLKSDKTGEITHFKHDGTHVRHVKTEKL